MSIGIYYTRNRGIRFLYCHITTLFKSQTELIFSARFLMRLSAIGLISAPLSNSVYVRPYKKRVRRRRAGSFPKQPQGIELTYFQNSPEQVHLHLLSSFASNLNLKLSFSSLSKRSSRIQDQSSRLKKIYLCTPNFVHFKKFKLCV